MRVCVLVFTWVNLSNGCCGLKDQQQEEVHDGPPITPTHSLHLWEREGGREGGRDVEGRQDNEI